MIGHSVNLILMSTLVREKGLFWISLMELVSGRKYAEGNYAINEWEIRANDYLIERAGDGSEIKIYFIEPSSTRILPNRCENCIETAGISISIRNVFDSEKIAFKLNDPDNSLPSPFPVFQSWTKFRRMNISINVRSKG